MAVISCFLSKHERFSLLGERGYGYPPSPSYQCPSQAEGRTGLAVHIKKKMPFIGFRQVQPSRAANFLTSLNWFSSGFFKGPALNICLNTVHHSWIEGKPS